MSGFHGSCWDTVLTVVGLAGFVLYTLGVSCRVNTTARMLIHIWLCIYLLASVS